MDFSYHLSIDGITYYTFGDLQIKQNANGMGTSGVCATEFDFSVAYSEYAAYPPKSGAVVEFGIEGSGVMYYFLISQRSRSGGKVTFKCYDKTLLFGMSADLFNIPYEAVNADNEDSGVITMANLVEFLAKSTGFEGCTSEITESGYFGSLTMKKSDIVGKTVRSLLETISAAWCGYFTAVANDYLDFVFFGTTAHTSCPTADHAAISMKSERLPISRVIVYTGSDYYYSGDENADVFATLTVQTDFASQKYADALLTRVKGYTYRSWECKKMIVDVSNLMNNYLPAISTAMSRYHVPDGVDPLTDFTANALTLNFTSTGVFAFLSSNEVTEDEYTYLGYISRKLEEKISDGEKLGNDMLITRYQGIIHLGEKTTDASTGEVTQNRYGYSKATSDGIVEFDGAMVSKVVPTSGKINEDGTEVTISYDSKSYKYNIEYDENGDIVGFAKEEIEEEGN